MFSLRWDGFATALMIIKSIGKRLRVKSDEMGEMFVEYDFGRPSAPTVAGPLLGERKRASTAHVTLFSPFNQHFDDQVSRTNFNFGYVANMWPYRSCQNGAILKVRARQVYRACEKCGISQLRAAQVFCSRFRTTTCNHCQMPGGMGGT